MSIFSTPQRDAAVARHLEELQTKLDAVPGLTQDARMALLAHAASGTAQVDVYESAGGDQVLWVRPTGAHPQYESRWSVAAWNLYCQGLHSRHLGQECNCIPCQDERFAEAIRMWQERQEREGGR